MKSYKVLEAHQGDRAYTVGDTRIADPNVVGHLVGFNVLEEIGDAPDQPATADPLAHASERIDALLAERGEILERLRATEVERDEARELLEAAQAAAAEAGTRAETAERDLTTARADADGAGAERDALKAEVEQLKAAAKPAGRRSN